MPPFAFPIFFLILGALWSFLYVRCADHLRLKYHKNGRQLPPGPWGLPIIGHLQMLGNLPHRTLHQLANKYGPIMFMRLGYVPTIVVSSSQAAELFLKTHDTVFASRPKIQASDYLSYGTKAMAFTEYGPYWRNVRKLCTLELLSKTKIDSFAVMRKEELRLVVESLREAAVAREVVDVSARVGEVIENMTYRMVFGRVNDKRFDLKGVIGETGKLAGAFNLADYVPFLLGALDLQMFPFAFAIFFLGLGALWFFLNHCKNDRKLPPGPGGLPIIGHLHMLGNLPHRTLHQLANKYGPIMSMRLGYVPTIVVSSAQAAKLFLKTHDVVFASRPKVQASKYMAYGVKGMAFTEYGSYWRNVRKLCTMELLSTTKIDSFAAVRREELRLVVESLKDAAAAREVVDISARTGEFIRNVTYRMVFGCIIDERFDLKGVIGEVVSLAGAFNLADYVPFLGALDLQGLTRRLKATSGAIDKILEMIIDDHVQDANGHERHHKDFIDVMLSLMNKPINSHDESQYMIDRSNIKAIVLDMLVGAIDTSATAIEWTLSELLRHPRVMKRLQEELESVIGMDQMLEETDLAKLVYLDMVVKESLRLHPVAPLLVPHESMEDIMINGYYIPKKSRIIINYFAIGRDRDAWSDNVEEFSPERFIGSNIDLRGREFQLIPFGSGRRGCPGMQLGLITIKLVLAQLVHGFDWELPNGMSPKDMDMSEEFGLALPRRNHLLAMPIHRSHI